MGQGHKEISKKKENYMAFRKLLKFIHVTLGKHAINGKNVTIEQEL
jgi:hypothetical protein